MYLPKSARTYFDMSSATRLTEWVRTTNDHFFFLTRRDTLIESVMLTRMLVYWTGIQSFAVMAIRPQSTAESSDPCLL